VVSDDISEQADQSDAETPPVGDAPAFDTSVAHVARVYNYWLGGKDNFAADRAAGEAALSADPSIATGVRANRAFLARTVRYLAGEVGIRQFLDIGTGIPTADNTHEVAQSVAPDSRVVYVDNDPVVLAHARALLTSTPEGATEYIEADMRDTAAILEKAAAMLDFSRPIAVMMIAVLHMIGDEDAPYGLVAALMDAMPPGSYLALSHVASDIRPDSTGEVSNRLNQMMFEKVSYRPYAAVEGFFDGLELVEPGVVRLPDWRPDSDARPAAPLWGGVGRKVAAG
jgi:hypothetical protein